MKNINQHASLPDSFARRKSECSFAKHGPSQRVGIRMWMAGRASTSVGAHIRGSSFGEDVSAVASASGVEDELELLFSSDIDDSDRVESFIVLEFILFIMDSLFSEISESSELFSGVTTTYRYISTYQFYIKKLILKHF